MYLCFLFYNILFIPHLYGKSLSTPSADNNLLSTNSTFQAPMKDLNNSLIITEGEAVKPEPPIATLPEETHSNLINLDKEIGKSKVKSIVPRKGVKYNPADDNVTDINVAKDRTDTSIIKPKLENVNISSTILPASTQSSNKTYIHNSTINSVTNITTKVPIKEKPNIPMKPSVLSAEAIKETDRKVAIEKAKLGTSSKPLIQNQLPFPKIKYGEPTSSSHPGMVMPIVITLLVVPMFAVLGYMALRRGQEAWKNRHYKRMDFLLDGMYND